MVMVSALRRIVGKAALLAVREMHVVGIVTVV